MMDQNLPLRMLTNDQVEYLEERSAISQHDGGLTRYQAGQVACRCFTAKYGKGYRAQLLVWLTNEKAQK